MLGIQDFKELCSTTPILPESPVIVDIILPASIMRLDALKWNGKFTRCLGWSMISPSDIR